MKKSYEWMTLPFDEHKRLRAAIPGEIIAILMVHPELFIAGGFIRAVLAGEPVADIDIFTRDASVIDEAVDTFIMQCMYGDYLAKIKNTCYTTTVNYEDFPPVQFVRNKAYSPTECLETVDFTICQAALWYDADISAFMSLCSPDFLRDVHTKQLVYTEPDRAEAPGGSLWRAVKYARRGYSISQMELARLVARCNQGIDKDDESTEFSRPRSIYSAGRIRAAMHMGDDCY